VDLGLGNYTSAVLYVGRRNNANLPLNGRITALIVRGAFSDDTTISNAERWVAGKTGVTL
jgi:hypothetical protein